jgi:hypothetical protein
VGHELRHRLFGHLCAPCELADLRPFIVQELKGRGVRDADIGVSALGESPVQLLGTCTKWFA